MTYRLSGQLMRAGFFLLLGMLISTAEARTWKSANGSYSVEAEFVSLEDGVAVLKRDADGQVIRVPLDKLSEADQTFARLKSAQQPQGKPMPDSTSNSTTPEPEKKTDSDSTATEPAEKSVPEAKLGAYTFSVPKGEGARTPFLLHALSIYGGKLKPDTAQRVQSGQTKWFTDEQGGLSWEVYVPPSYSPDEPIGLFVFISAGPEGTMPAQWKSVIDKHRLIWMGINLCGNSEATSIRHAMALESVARMNEIYALDPDRIYISGSSGGGRVASQVMITDADVFTGGFPHVGCNPYRKMPGEKPGTFYGTPILKMSKENFNLAKQRNRFVFLTGSKDFNRFQTIGVHKIYKEDGFQHLTYLEVPGMGHNAPDAEWFEKGIVALDAPLHAAAEEQYEVATKAMNRRLKGEALEGFRRAALHGKEGAYLTDAKEKYRELQTQYQSEVKALETMIQKREFSDAIKGASGLKRQWGKFAEKEGQRLIDAIAAARKADR